MRNKKTKKKTDFVTCVVVTYNRKQLLIRCLDAVLNQSKLVNRLIIIDNASTDGTAQLLTEQGYIEDPKSANSQYQKNKTEIIYQRLDKNTGGAGGFYQGIKEADQRQTDLFWIMDDDGYPSPTCLVEQQRYLDRYDYIMPVSLDEDNTTRLTWINKTKTGKKTRLLQDLLDSYTNHIMPQATPFNGLLMTKALVDKVGYPNKEMFIWGDDFEHQLRCQKAGFEIITTLNALFYHPVDKAQHYRIFFGLIPINYSPSKLHFTCLIRNSTYNYWHYKGKHLIFIKFLMYSYFFLITQKLDFKGLWHYLSCVSDGIRGKFKRHLKYL